MSQSSDSGLKRELGLFDSTMLVAGSMIGSGIFIVSADIARTVGCAGWLLAIWVITGLLTITAALSYGELAGMMPKAGGQYVYLREAYGPLAGFLYGWTLFLVIQTGTIAAVAVAFAKFTGVLLPWFSERHILWTTGRFHVSAAQLLAIGIIAALTMINLRGLRLGKIVQNLFTVTKIASLCGLSLLVFFALSRGPALAANFQTAWQASWLHRTDVAQSRESLAGFKLLSALGVAMVGSLFSATAWENITYTAAEVRRPERDIPLSLALGTALVMSLYLLANVTYLAALPLSDIQTAANDRVATAALSALFGAPGASLMAALIMVSTFGCNNGLILSGARVYYAMARDGLFFEKIGSLNSRSVPGAALILQAVWAGLLCLSGAYGDLLDYVIFATLVFYITTVAAVFVLRRKRPEAPRPYKAWGYPLVPILYILAAGAISVDLLIYKPAYTWPGVFIVLLGIPVYYLRRRTRP
ncbi:MAG TPA: amino acid transporter [Elusimicrobia bacterium]|nr:amino acid transporter [Elusimicrobiota bacterium]HBT62700.1 amino acid transporter [Elusimicrobiota bacterium]